MSTWYVTPSQNKELKFHGMTLDFNLTFLPHVKKVNDKAKTFFGKITRLIK